MSFYDDITIGTVLSEIELETRNRKVYNNSLIGVPTGKTSDDGSLEYIITAVSGSTNYVNGKPQGTVFGADMVTAQENPEISGKFDLGLELQGSTAVITTTGYVGVTTDESTLEVGTGTASDGAVIFTSKKRIRYEPGTPIFGKFTAAFPELSESNGNYSMGPGLGEGFSTGDSGIGIYQRRVDGALEYGCILVRDGVATYYPYNGTLPHNPEYLNIYRIEWGYLGVAPFNLYWRDTVNEKWVRMHRQVFNQKVSSLLKPDLPVGVFAQNEGNTNDIKLLVGSFEAGTINGGKKFDPAARPSTYERSFTGTAGTNQLIFAFRNPNDVTMYDYVDVTGVPTTRSFRNSIASQLLEVGLTAIDNNKLVDVDLVIVPIADITTGTFTPVDLGYSVLSVSEDCTPVLTNARYLEIFTLGKDTVLNKIIETLDLLLPNEVALFVYTTTSVNFDFSAYIKYQDLF